jgi:hypothetical protein
VGGGGLTFEKIAVSPNAQKHQPRTGQVTAGKAGGRLKMRTMHGFDVAGGVGGYTHSSSASRGENRNGMENRSTQPQPNNATNNKSTAWGRPANPRYEGKVGGGGGKPPSGGKPMKFKVNRAGGKGEAEEGMSAAARTAAFKQAIKKACREFFQG